MLVSSRSISKFRYFGRQIRCHSAPATWLTSDEQTIQIEAEKFANNRIKPLVRKMDNDSTMDPSLIKDLFDCGFMGIQIPQEYGGSGLNLTSSMIVIEEIARIDPSIAVLVDVHNTVVCNTFQSVASPEQISKYLPRLASKSTGSFCLSEPSSGSDAFALKTRADKSSDGSYYTLTGQKLWISNASHADIFIMVANVDLSAGYKGITIFLVERDMAGFHIGKPESKLGLKASSTCPLVLDGVKVPTNNILGKIGQGYKTIADNLNEGRIGIAAQMVGLSRGCLDEVVPYLQERSQSGKHLFEFQAIQHQVAQLATNIEAARSMLFNVSRLRETNQPIVKQAAMLKLFASQVANEVASKSIELLGGVGFTTAFMAEKFYRDVKAGVIYEGTSNIQLNTIAKCIRQEEEKKQKK